MGAELTPAEGKAGGLRGGEVERRKETGWEGRMPEEYGKWW